MTIDANPTRAVTVEDYEHPEWCDLTRCEPVDGLGEGAHGCHHSTGTTWGVQTDEVDVTVMLTLGDDIIDGKNDADTSISLVLQNWAWHSSPGRCDADMNAEDARMLATILNRYADLADRSNRNRFTYEAKDVRHRA